MTVVSLLKCRDYGREELLEAVYQSCINISFNPENLKGARVAVKPNLLTPAAPETGVTTHPEFFRAVIRFIRDNKGIPVLVESPAFFSLDKVLKKCGYDPIIADEKVEIADTTRTTLIKNDNGRKYKSFHVAADIIDSDYIFNLPKMKTHSLTYFTGAVKNLFGTIHGLEKSKWHVKTENEREFISFLLDLYGAFIYTKKESIVTLMDGITGLEGEGPGKSGRPVQSAAVIAGMDAMAVDAVAVRTAGLDINRAAVLIEGGRRGLGVSVIDNVKITGASFNDFNNSFVPPKTGNFFKGLPVSTKLLKNLIIKKPVPDSKKCTLCYQCKTICPAGVIEKSRDGKIPYYNYRKCIRCYCCMEICPEGAIDLKMKFR